MKNLRTLLNQLFSKTNTAKTAIGIDLNNSAIRIAALQHLKQISVVNLMEVPITDQRTITTNIKSALKQISMPIKTAIIAVPDSAVMNKTIQLDNSLTENEITQHLNLEAEHYFQQPAANICIDFYLLGPSKIAPNKVDVQLTAAWRKEVDYRSHLISDAGFSIKAIDVESQALLRLLRYQKQALDSTVILVEQDYFLLVLVAQDTVVQTYTEHFATTCSPSQLAEQISNQLQLILATQRISTIHNIYLTGCNLNLLAVINCLNAAEHDWNVALLSFDFLPQDKFNFVVAAGLALWDWSA